VGRSTRCELRMAAADSAAGESGIEDTEDVMASSSLGWEDDTPEEGAAEDFLSPDVKKLRVALLNEKVCC
jgi:hypothetical protein